MHDCTRLGQHCDELWLRLLPGSQQSNKQKHSEARLLTDSVDRMNPFLPTCQFRIVLVPMLARTFALHSSSPLTSE
jgi:hypothetical protein